MNAHPLLRQLLIITFISGAVLLSFKYVLPLIFPFLFACFRGDVRAFRAAGDQQALPVGAPRFFDGADFCRGAAAAYSGLSHSLLLVARNPGVVQGHADLFPAVAD